MERFRNQKKEDRNVQNERAKKIYLAPRIEVMEVKIEKGYAASFSLDDRNNNTW